MAKPGRGRPRDTTLDQRIVKATAEAMLKHGYAGLSVDEVAATVGVAKTTIYRRWPTKAHLVLKVVQSMQAVVEAPDTGDLRADLLTVTTSMSRAMRQPGARELAAELVAASALDETLDQGVRRLWAARREPTLAVLRRAGVAHPEVVVDVLAGSQYYRLLLTSDPLDDAYAGQLIDLLFTRLAVEES
ncbi:MAG: TetR/AcrR family transcriptional regulator [Nocardiopsaceae bacterium]|jgi:AcrR family transcriptional regulator|nr:TetR/AcrR family transcriptional regulator [Nocardiopsaceae bacterium]